MHEPECDGIGTECDHIERGDDHRLSNLQWLSGPCHHAKTLREAQAAVMDRKAWAMLPIEEHPNKHANRGRVPPPLPSLDLRG